MSENERADNADVAWLLARERGQTGQTGPTVSGAIVARYERLQAMIAELPATPAGVTARAGWQDEVLAAIDAAEAEAKAPSRLALVALPEPSPASSPASSPEPSLASPPEPSPAASPEPSPAASPASSPASINSVTPARVRTRPRRWAAATAAFAMAAVAVILLTVYYDGGRGTDGTMAAPLLTHEVVRASQMRGADPSVGDTLIVRAELEGPGELRIYDKAGVEQAHCTTPAPDCTVDRSGTRTKLQLTMQVRVMGALRAVLFTAPLGRPSGDIGADIEAAMRAGIARFPRDLVEVQ